MFVPGSPIKVSLNSVDPTSGVNFVAAIEKKTALSNPRPADYKEKHQGTAPVAIHTPGGIATCDDVQRLLDRTRAFNIAETQDDSVDGLNRYMSAMLPTLNGSNLTLSDGAVLLTHVLAPWIGSFGVLFVTFEKDFQVAAGVTYTVSMDGSLFGNPNCHDRIISGHAHNLVITSSATMTPLYSNSQFSIADGENTVLVISGKGVK